MGDAISPKDMGISIDRNEGSPIYIQLYEQLKGYITEGILPEDSRLPAIRSFAEYLGVNNITVVNAYKLLEDNKLIYKKVGSGSFAMPLKDEINLRNDAVTVSDEIEFDTDVGTGNDMINLSTASPDPELFPVGDFRRVLNEVLERDAGRAFMYHESMGYKPLRESITEYLRTCGVESEASGIHVISGAQQGIDIVSRVLLANGDYVFVESPTYNGAVAVFRSRGAKIIEIPLLSDGPDMKELDKMLKLIKPKFIYVMPNFQNPTGCTYSERKRKHLLLLCRKYDVMVVEDDYMSDLSYLDKVEKPLKGLDKENRVIYIKSFSKIFMPGLRVGYMIIPDSIKEKVMNMKYMTDISTSGLMQRVLDLYFRSGTWDKHLKYMKKEYSVRYIEAVRAVKKHLREASFSQPYGGLNLWIKLPAGISSSELFERCKEEKVLFTPGTVFIKTAKGEQYMRISFAGAGPLQINDGISTIGRVMEKMKSNAKRA
ncbi:MAG TPA: PLP-dependent aminotransferase family protein [Bacillota bacterium]|nr:PLP-dependent aminotransferase family protein [Bacillota bacterium]HPL54158.1 PLP-dependent aminotransferase family protein [Bacillota bacterium]